MGKGINVVAYLMYTYHCQKEALPFHYFYTFQNKAWLSPIDPLFLDDTLPSEALAPSPPPDT